MITNPAYCSIFTSIVARYFKKSLIYCYKQSDKYKNIQLKKNVSDKQNKFNIIKKNLKCVDG